MTILQLNYQNIRLMCKNKNSLFIKIVMQVYGPRLEFVWLDAQSGRIFISRLNKSSSIIKPLFKVTHKLYCQNMPAAFPPSRKLFMFHKCEGSKYELMAFRGYALLLIFFLVDYKQVLIQHVGSKAIILHINLLGYGCRG